MEPKNHSKRVLFGTPEDLPPPTDEVPCPDSVPQISSRVSDHFRSCVIVNLYKQCAKSLAGSWAVSDNVEVQELRTCGLSNYLFMANLKDHVPVQMDEPRKVFLRVYGEVLRSSVDSIVLDSVNFAILSEKRIGPRLYGVFPGGRIEEYIESRTLAFSELSIPNVIQAIARHMARIHGLNMPFCKQPTFMFKMSERFLAQLTGVRKPPCRPVPNLSSASLLALEREYIEDSDHTTNGCLPEVDFQTVQELAVRFRLLEEYEWLKDELQKRTENPFPVVFCHNDLQENNVLVLNDPKPTDIYEILPIDFEYAGYNYRGFDVGNHFNEWCFDYTYPESPYFAYDLDLYPSREQQAQFWTEYLAAFRTEKRPSMDSTNAYQELGLGDSNFDYSTIDFDKLWIESTYGSLYSHLFWAIWSLIQTQISSIRFRFDEYAAARMEAYYRQKALLFPKTSPQFAT
ncbi:hypothetical protein EG68_04934 [Paragonimus skrjabini miyazakii]|uniref:Choline/ethanolamine kinase n=1 Tax=Paragonimus skrjabini miyazakii TaxID=59628 RepID=A0A8S9YZY0_9TREM|nr:hypothetical protein EG68_04934 [Paragonimus skrjabini miyazakii]